MRISERQRYHITNSRVDDARASNAKVLETLSTLKSINRLSDDPVGVGQIIRGRNHIANSVQFQRNIEHSKGFIERSESALKGMTDGLIRAKELAINLANGPFDAKSRDAAAQEVAQLIDQTVALGNTTYLNKYIFSGYRTSTPSLSDDGEYLGDDGAIFVESAAGDWRRINLSTRYLFEPDAAEREAGHFNLVETMRLLHSGLKGDSVDEIRIALDELDFQLEKVTSYQAKLGGIWSGLETSSRVNDLDQELARDQKSRVEEVDMFRASSDFHRTEAILQGTLLASSKVLQPSLLNFLQ